MADFGSPPPSLTISLSEAANSFDGIVKTGFFLGAFLVDRPPLFVDFRGSVEEEVDGAWDRAVSEQSAASEIKKQKLLKTI
jgi:hypothetical protein